VNWYFIIAIVCAGIATQVLYHGEYFWGTADALIALFWFGVGCFHARRKRAEREKESASRSEGE
jgi:hypothetical protein